MRKRHDITINGVKFQARSGDQLLEAALLEGVDVPHDCRAGQCGTCVVRVRHGIALGGETRTPGCIHACQARVFSDMAVEFERLPPVIRLNARILALQTPTDDVVELTIGAERPPRYLAGQYYKFAFAGFPARAFSPAAPLDHPHTGPEFRLNIKRVRGGRVSPSLGSTIGVGHALTMVGPFGRAFLRPQLTNRLVLVCGGTGFAPIWAIADAALRENPYRSIMLVAGVRKLSSLYMGPALVRAAQMPAVQVVVTAEEGAQLSPAVRAGRPHGHLPELCCDDIVYAAGAPAMVDAVADAALAAGAEFFCDPFEPSGQVQERGWLGTIFTQFTATSKAA